MARGVFSDGENRRLLPFALGSACATAAYSLIDGMGARAAVSAGQYVAWLFIFDLVFFSVVSLVWKGRAVLAGTGPEWLTGSLAAAASYGAYAIAVWAMTRAPIALVAALRETSILFAVLIGWIAFGERMSLGKALAAALIVAGVMVTRL
jgi:drug/metabolite transporter (DMT)-like permease